MTMAHKEANLGDILDVARRDRASSAVLKDEAFMGRRTHTLVFPRWMDIALTGDKIRAIKELKEISYHDGKTITLRQAKTIVESITDGLRVEFTEDAA